MWFMSVGFRRSCLAGALGCGLLFGEGGWATGVVEDDPCDPDFALSLTGTEGPICIGDAVTFTATVTCLGAEPVPASPVSLSVAGATGDYTVNTTHTKTWVGTASQVGLQGVVASASGGGGAKHIDVTVLKAQFSESEYAACWALNGTFDAKSKLTSDSYDKDGMAWSITVQSGAVATISATGVVTFGNTAGKYTVTATPGGMTGCAASVDLSVVQVEIKAEDGTSTPETAIGVGKSEKYTAKVTPALTGSYSWATTSGKMTLANAATQTATVNAGADASTTVGAEDLVVQFTPAGSSVACEGTHSLTVVKPEVKAEDGTSTPETGVAVGKVEKYKCVVSPAGFTVVDADFAWSEDPASDKITTTDLARQTCTVTAGANSSTAANAETIQVVYTPQGGGQACAAVTHSLTVVKPEIKAEDGTSTPETAIGVGKVEKYKCVVSPAGFAVADADFAWSENPASDKITTSDLAKQTCTVTAGASSSTAVGAETIQVIYTPQGGGQACAAVTHSLTVVKPEIKAEDGTSTPETAIAVGKVEKYKCKVSPTGFTVADADFAWSENPASDKIDTTDLAKQTCTVTAGADASADVDDETIQVVYTPQGGQTCAAVTHSLTVVKPEIKAEDGTSTPETAIGVGKVERYKCAVSPTAFAVADADFAWCENPASGKITTTDLAKQTCTVTAGADASADVDDETIQVVYTPQGASQACNAVTHSLTVVKPAIKAEDGTSAPKTAFCVENAVKYKCVVSPAGFAVADADFAWSENPASDKITTSDLAKQTCTVTAGVDASAAVLGETIQVIYTPQGGGEPCDAVTHSLTVVKVEVTGLQTTPYLPGTDNPSDSASMGDNVTVTYRILPSAYSADLAGLFILDKDGNLVYNSGAINASGGTHSAVWNVSLDSLRSVNSLKAPYNAEVRIRVNWTYDGDSKDMAVVQSTAAVVAETSTTTGDPVKECMEGRWVTFTATASGFVSEQSSHDIDFTFHYTHANGTTWTSTDWSFDLVEDNTAVADNVLTGDADHFFDTPIYVTVADDYTHTATSPTVTVRVFELWIDYFQDATSQNPWRVVVDRDIAYAAIASEDCTSSWAWDMADGVPDQWNPTGGNDKQGTTMVIPNSDLPSDTDWDHFGGARGTVDVSCEDEEGNNHHFYSTSMSPPKAEVFFLKNALTNPQGTVPNWYYYWRKFLPWGQIQTLTFDATETGYASTDPQARSTAIGVMAGGLNDETTHRGIHTFYETLAHESHHIVLWNAWWGVGGAPTPALDTDNDAYPDAWETTDPDAIAAGFAVPQNDSYGLDNSAGYNYEEEKCRQVEHALQYDAYDRSDWSMDPSGTNQGKNWER